MSSANDNFAVDPRVRVNLPAALTILLTDEYWRPSMLDMLKLALDLTQIQWGCNGGHAA